MVHKLKLMQLMHQEEMWSVDGLKNESVAFCLKQGDNQKHNLQSCHSTSKTNTYLSEDGCYQSR